MGIHDGVRPFVSTDVIEECFETTREEYAIPVYAVTDTLRYIDQHGGGKNVLRSDYRVVQTFLQTFDIGLAKQAFNQEYKEQFTDDASVIESLGCQVAMVEGNRENIKITTPFDIKIAEDTPEIDTNTAVIASEAPHAQKVRPHTPVIGQKLY